MRQSLVAMVAVAACMAVRAWAHAYFLETTDIGPEIMRVVFHQAAKRGVFQRPAAFLVLPGRVRRMCHVRADQPMHEAAFGNGTCAGQSLAALARPDEDQLAGANADAIEPVGLAGKAARA